MIDISYRGRGVTMNRIKVLLKYVRTGKGFHAHRTQKPLQKVRGEDHVREQSHTCTSQSVRAGISDQEYFSKTMQQYTVAKLHEGA